MPYEVTFIENKAVITGFLENSDGSPKLQLGDIIEEINEISINEIINEKFPYTPASNKASKVREISWDLLRSRDPKITIVYRRDQCSYKIRLKGIPREKTNPYQRLENKDTAIVKISNDIVYLNPWSFRKKNVTEIINEISNTKGLIIDLRFPFYEEPVPLLNYLIPKPTTFAKLTKGSIQHPGLFTFIEKLKEIEVGEFQTHSYTGRIIILNNEYTQSSAEFATMALRTINNSLIIGSRTSGANGPVSMVSLPGGIQTAITGAGVYYPDGRETQRTGIIPDIEIRPTIKSIKEGRDVLLEKAIELLNTK